MPSSGRSGSAEGRSRTTRSSPSPWRPSSESPTHRVADTTVEGFPAVTLSAADAQVEATFAPSAGMVGCSLQHAGDELLETQGGLARYARERSTMGIPLLHPWANRIDGFRYEAAGRAVELDPDSALLSFDPNGLPIHGLVSAYPGWEVVDKTADQDSARLAARLDFAADPQLMEPFPFAHELGMAVELRGSRLTIATTLTATGDDPVPVSFGYHPYFRLPGQPAAEWEIETPVQSHVEVDDRLIPTGASKPATIEPGPIGERTWDDGYDALAKPARFSATGGGRRLTVELLEGYPVAVIWRPPQGEFICFEPMTARTNALGSGDPDLRFVEPGGSFRAAFSVSVEAV